MKKFDGSIPSLPSVGKNVSDLAQRILKKKPYSSPSFQVYGKIHRLVMAIGQSGDDFMSNPSQRRIK